MGDREAEWGHTAAAEPPGDGLVGEGRRADRQARAGSAHAPHVGLRDAPVPLTAQDVAEITRLLEESDFLELRIEHEGFKLTLKRAPAAGSEASTGATTG